MGFLSAVVHVFPEFFALPEYVLDSVENLLDGVKAIRHEVPHYIAFLGLGIVVTIEVENPVCIKVGMDGHVKGIGGQIILVVVVAFAILVLGVTWVTAKDCSD